MASLEIRNGLHFGSRPFFKLVGLDGVGSWRPKHNLEWGQEIRLFTSFQFFITFLPSIYHFSCWICAPLLCQARMFCSCSLTSLTLNQGDRMPSCTHNYKSRNSHLFPYLLNTLLLTWSFFLPSCTLELLDVTVLALAALPDIALQSVFWTKCWLEKIMPSTAVWCVVPCSLLSKSSGWIQCPDALKRIFNCFRSDMQRARFLLLQSIIHSHIWRRKADGKLILMFAFRVI